MRGGGYTAKAEVKIVTLARIVIIEYIISWNNKIIDIKTYFTTLGRVVVVHKRSLVADEGFRTRTRHGEYTKTPISLVHVVLLGTHFLFNRNYKEQLWDGSFCLSRCWLIGQMKSASNWATAALHKSP